MGSFRSLSARRAWIEIANFCRNRFCPTSLSARRAWIEIKYVVKDSDFSGVALRKESVDRNLKRSKTMKNRRKSLSARRAWIEIVTDDVSLYGVLVALRKESVDRNANPVLNA